MIYLKKVNLKKAIFIFILVYLASFTISKFFLNNTSNNIIYETNVIVSDHPGFDINTSAITFGMLAPEFAATRNLFIDSEENAQEVIIYVDRNFSNWLFSNKNEFIMQPNMRETVALTLEVPKDANIGEYSGEVKIKIKQIN